MYGNKLFSQKNPSPPLEYQMVRPLYPCHTIAYDTSVCQRMNKISHTLVHADKR